MTSTVNGDPHGPSPGFYFDTFDSTWAPTGGEPTFALDADGSFVWWYHDCTLFLGENGAPIPMRAHGRLPISPAGWALLSSEPLTLSPSILCYRCQTHGYIRDGAWMAV